jgi:glycosyltransferase involved in cell wall biosynthesis
MQNKILIFIATANAESTINEVLKNIPAAMFNCNYEILLIDDASSDRTFERASVYKALNKENRLTVLVNPGKQGYGACQKLGFQYAIDRDFVVIVILQNDGPYAPEMWEKLIHPVLAEEAEAVFGTRIAHGFKLSGIMGMRHGGFHPGNRVYSVKTLKQIPFALNTDSFHFDAEIAMQLKLNESRIREVPMPIRIGNAGWHVNGIAFAWNVLKSSRRAKLHQMNFSYQRQFDIVRPGRWYPPKFDFLSSHTMAINEVRPGARVLDIGCGAGHVGRELEKRSCQVTGIDIAAEAEGNSLQEFRRIDLHSESIPFLPDSFDFILILDVLEHLDLSSQFNLLEKIRTGSKIKKPLLIITVPNIAFLFIRLQLLFGNFNYGKQGILDITHRHFFTFKSIRRFLKQAGYKIEKIKGIPPPYPLVIGNHVMSRFLLRINAVLIWLIPGIFAYQIFVKATPVSTASQLLQLANEKSLARESKSTT